MKAYQNPLIQDNAIDTLTHAEKVLAFLQDYHLTSSQPDTPIHEDVHGGLFWICGFVRQALEYELKRLEES